MRSGEAFLIELYWLIRFINAGDVSNCTGPENFACSDGLRCIPAHWKCDSSPDCADLSDEPFDCRKLPLLRSEFKLQFDCSWNILDTIPGVTWDDLQLSIWISFLSTWFIRSNPAVIDYGCSHSAVFPTRPFGFHQCWIDRLLVLAWHFKVEKKNLWRWQSMISLFGILWNLIRDSWEYNRKVEWEIKNLVDVVNDVLSIDVLSIDVPVALFWDE